MPIEYNLKKDIRYQQGYEEGYKKGYELALRTIILRLVETGMLTTYNIAAILKVEMSWIEEITQEELYAIKKPEDK